MTSRKAEASQYLESHQGEIVGRIVRIVVLGDGALQAAKQHFQTALALRANDPAALRLLERLVELRADVLPDHWDGSEKFTEK